MSINKKLIIVLTIGSLLGVSSCKKYLDVNKNPNVVQTPTVQTLLPAGQLIVGSSLGVDLEITGSIWGQYWTQNPGASQYHPLDQYAPGQDFFSYPWLYLYQANENFRQLYILADSQKKKQYMAISLLMQAYTFQLLTDAWGDVPFSQALKGGYADGHIINPAYDKQMAIYTGIIGLIDSANTLINPADPSVPGADDLIYAGNMAKWQKFSNTLMLRVLLRMSQVNAAEAQAGIIALYTSSGGNFIGEGDDAAITGYGSNSANKNPLYAEETSTTLASTQNIVGSNTCIDSMNSNNDYRAYVFYEAAANTGTIVGIDQGHYNFTPTSGSFSVVSNFVGGDAQNSASSNAPVNFLTSYESLFLQAEVAARGWVGAGSDSSLFYQGIQASFDYYSADMNSYYGVTGAVGYNTYISGDTSVPGTPGYWTIYPTGGSTDQKVRFIITQKWFAMCGNQGFEAWTEWRRTGYPDFLITSLSAVNGGTKPRRFLYPTSESTVNSSFPGLAPLTLKMWWDTI